MKEKARVKKQIKFLNKHRSFLFMRLHKYNMFYSYGKPTLWRLPLICRPHYACVSQETSGGIPSRQCYDTFEAS